MKFANMIVPAVCAGLLCIAGVCVLLHSGKPPSGIPASQESDREVYLFTHGWKGDELSARAVVIPGADDPVLGGFAALQEVQGLPLAAHTGAQGMCYTYTLRQSRLQAILLTADGILVGAACYDPETGEVFGIGGT